MNRIDPENESYCLIRRYIYIDDQIRLLEGNAYIPGNLSIKIKYILTLQAKQGRN